MLESFIGHVCLSWYCRCDFSCRPIHNRCGVQWIARSFSEPRKTYV